MLLEICIDSLASARAAIAAGADRLELCSALAVGGLTPYTALLRQIRAESHIPIRCLMRHRAGDFLYPKYSGILSELVVRTENVHDLVYVLLLHVLTSGAEVLTGVKLSGLVGKHLTDSSSHSETAIRVDVDLAYCQ